MNNAYYGEHWWSLDLSYNSYEFGT